MGLQCQGNHEHVWKPTSEGKREYPSAMSRRLVNGFVHDLHPCQLHLFLSEADLMLSSSPAVVVASSAQETERDIFPAERECVRKLIHRLHWQAVKVDIFELEDSQRKDFFAHYMDAACKLSSCSRFLAGNPRQRFEPNGATLISHLAKDWMQHLPQFQFLISDLGGRFVR